MLEARNIHKVYNNGKKELAVLRGVDLSIKDSEFAAVVGPSGAGKSTLLHIIGGLDNPVQGKVLLDNRDIYALGERELSEIRNSAVGFVFQFYHLLSEFTVLENVMMPGLISAEPKARKAKTKEDALKILREVGLAERLDYFPAQLSGGEKQRVAIARSLINSPHLLLCDEPTGNLDSKNGEEIVALIKKINLQNHMSVLMVTHNPELAKQADKIYHLKDGVLVN